MLNWYEPTHASAGKGHASLAWRDQAIAVRLQEKRKVVRPCRRSPGFSVLHFPGRVGVLRDSRVFHDRRQDRDDLRRFIDQRRELLRADGVRYGQEPQPETRFARLLRGDAALRDKVGLALSGAGFFEVGADRCAGIEELTCDPFRTFAPECSASALSCNGLHQDPSIGTIAIAASSTDPPNQPNTTRSARCSNSTFNILHSTFPAFLRPVDSLAPTYLPTRPSTRHPVPSRYIR